MSAKDGFPVSPEKIDHFRERVTSVGSQEIEAFSVCYFGTPSPIGQGSTGEAPWIPH